LVWGTAASPDFLRPRVAAFLGSAFLVEAAGLAGAADFLALAAGTASGASFLEEVLTPLVFATLFLATAFFSVIVFLFLVSAIYIFFQFAISLFLL
jgi:hypothetical protein